MRIVWQPILIAQAVASALDFGDMGVVQQAVEDFYQASLNIDIG